MILYKAVNKKHLGELSSLFKGQCIYDASMMELIASAMGHIKKANQKKTEDKQDYWISATNDFDTAYRYLLEHQEDVYGYDGIIRIELPHTERTGEIFDDHLRQCGYLSKSVEKGIATHHWTPNEDGIIWLLDMSRQTTINYLASVYWLKGNDTTFRDLRVLRTSRNDHEFLILGDHIRYIYYPLESLTEAVKDLMRQESSKNIPSIHDQLFRLLLEEAPNSAIKKELLKTTGEMSNDLEMRQIEMDNLINHLYGMLEERYSKIRAKKCFTELRNLAYEDKDIIDFQAYDPISQGTRKIDFDIVKEAYLYSGSNMYQVMQENPVYQLLPYLYSQSLGILKHYDAFKKVTPNFDEIVYLGYVKDDGI